MTALADLARADQIRAAMRHAQTAMRTASAYSGSSIHEGANVAWVVRQVTELLVAVALPTARLCPHAGPDKAPQPLFAAVWDPGRLTCAPCGLKLPKLGPDQDATCDRCGKTVRPIFPGAVQFGLLTLSWGLCRRCCRETGVPVCSDRMEGAR